MLDEAVARGLIRTPRACYNHAMDIGDDIVRLDLRGVKCPLNWAHAKVRLEQMRRGQILELILDDPRGARDIPRAAENEGFFTISNETLAGGAFRLRIEK